MLANKERILQKMEEFNLDVIIASHPENVSYLSDFQSHLPYMYRFLNVESYALIAQNPNIEPSLLISRVDLAWAARFPTWVQEVYNFGNPYYALSPEGVLSEGEKRYKDILDDLEHNAPSAGEALVRALMQKGLEKARIGLDEKNISPATREQITRGLPNAKIIDAFELFRVIRMVKTKEELERLKTVGLMNERATRSVLNQLREGITEDELGQHFLEATAREGAVFEFWNSTGGTQSSMNIMSSGHFHPPSGYRLKRGDMFRYDGGSIYNKYHSDAGGCALIGSPTQRQKMCYEAVTAGMDRAIELLKPGAIPSKIFDEVKNTVERAGIKDYSKMARFCGHGIGIEARDYPIFTAAMKSTSPFLPGTYDIPIEEGMVISIEIPYGELGLGGFQVEYTLLVTRDGCEKLYPHDRELVVQ